MNPIEKFVWYRRQYGLRAAVLRVVERVSGRTVLVKQSPVEQFMVQKTGEPSEVGASAAAARLVSQRFGGVSPLPVYQAPGPKLRLNLVTDSINSGSLFGGVGTSIILAALLAKRTGAVLRVITRTQEPFQPSFKEVLRCNGVEYNGNVEFSFIDVADPDSQLDVCPNDYFLTTSWWTTASVLGSIPPSRVIYLLQEDERMFYPYGDDWVRCSETISRRDITVVLNTKLLRDHLVTSGLPHLENGAIFFEPAFPAAKEGGRRVPVEGERFRLFFYARPNNLRNLFYRGIEVLDEAVRSGVLDPGKWEIILVGKDVPALTLGGGEPTIMPTLGWSDYGKFVRTIDLGFCLMATPHPSYPPLDLAAVGATVVTNRFGVKQDLSMYSRSILTAEVDKASLVAALQEAVGRIECGDIAAGNIGLADSWEKALFQVTEVLAENVLR